MKTHPPFTFFNWTDNGIKLQCGGVEGVARTNLAEAGLVFLLVAVLSLFIHKMMSADSEIYDALQLMFG